MGKFVILLLACVVLHGQSVPASGQTLESWITSLSVGEMRAVVASHGLSSKNCVEKSELRDKVRGAVEW